MTPREMLELAAKAAGYTVNARSQAARDAFIGRENVGLWLENGSTNWNPLTDDGDALRLAVSLGIHIEQNTAFKRACALWYGKAVLREELFVSWGDDKYAATRRAILLAAAEIGKAMP